MTSPGYFQVRYEDGSCYPESIIDSPYIVILFKVSSVYWLIYIYITPCTLFIIFYGLVIYEFYKRRHQSAHLGSSKVIDKATSELTKTAIVVTVIFIITFCYDSLFYFLGYLDLVLYVKNTPIQKVGIWLASFNSFANPFVYGLLVPAYRHSLRLTFCRTCSSK